MLYNLIHTFYKKHNIPMLCNTSLNDKGEPIINKIEEMFNFALRKKIKIAYVNGYRIELEKHENFKETNPCERVYNKYFKNREYNEEGVNPYRLPKHMIYFIYKSYDVYKKYSMQSERDVEIIKMIEELSLKTSIGNMINPKVKY